MRRGGALAVAGLILTASCAGTDADVASTERTSTTTATSTTTTTLPPTTIPPTTTTTPASPGAVEVPAGADLYADPPVPDPATPPGTLLRYQLVDQGAAAHTAGDLWRVMYTSTNALGGAIPVTGTVRVPTGAPPAGGRPVISWAHGTSGTADRCAPSKQLEFPPAPDPMVDDGYVIAATDYAGLGTPGLHPYFDGAGEGRAVLDIVTATTHLPGASIAGSYALWGHSQGGHAVLFARQLAAERLPDRRLVGTVALAPPSLVKDSMTAILVALQPKGFAAMTVAGIAAIHPDALLSQILTPPAVSAILQTVDTGCSREVDQAMSLFGKRNIVVANPNQVQPWATYLDASEPAMAPGTAPLLLVHAVDDLTVPQLMSSVVKDRTCGRGEPTLRWLTASGGHNGIVGDTRAQARQWTIDRFAGVAPPSNCGQPDGAPPA